MWNSVLADADRVVEQVLFGLTMMLWRSPVAGMVVLISLLGLSAILWREMIEGSRATPRPLAERTRPICLR